MNKKILAEPGAALPAPLSPPGEAVAKVRGDEFFGPAIDPLLRRYENAVDIVAAGANAVGRIISNSIANNSEDTALALQPFRCAAGIRADYSLAGDIRLQNLNCGTSQDEKNFKTVAFRWYDVCRPCVEYKNRLENSLLCALCDFLKAWRNLTNKIRLDMLPGIRDVFFQDFHNIVEGPAKEIEIKIFARQLLDFEKAFVIALEKPEGRYCKKLHPFFEAVRSEVKRGRDNGQSESLKSIIDDMKTCPDWEATSGGMKTETLCREYRSFMRKHHPEEVRKKAGSTPRKKASRKRKG